MIQIKDKKFAAATIILIALLVFFVSMTVYSKEDNRTLQIERHYQTLEKEMVREVRAYMNAEGYTNCGISLTRVVDVNSKRAYTLTIHHDKIDNMGEEERQALGTELGQFGFDYNNCTFERDFLLN